MVISLMKNMQKGSKSSMQNEEIMALNEKAKRGGREMKNYVYTAMNYQMTLFTLLAKRLSESWSHFIFSRKLLNEITSPR